MPDYNPAFLKRDPATGLLFYDFDGHISARGVDFTMPTVATLDDFRMVRWIRQDNGARGGYIAVVPQGAHESDMLMYAEGGDYVDGVFPGTLTASAGLSMRSNNSVPYNAANEVRVVVNSPTNPQRNAKLLDGLGNSDFLLGSRDYTAIGLGGTSFAGGWTNYGGSYAGASFIQLGKQVHVCGLIRATAGYAGSGTNSVIIQGLPPANGEYLLFQGASRTDGNNALARLDIADNSGDLQIISSFTGGVNALQGAVGEWITLDYTYRCR